jgi:DNA-binding transcriptional MerR regulator
MDEHAELKDAYQGLEARADDIALSLRELPIDYKLADKCADIGFAVEDIKEWYEKRKKDFEEYELEKKLVLDKIELIDTHLKKLYNDVETLKLQVFSHDQHRGSYSRLSEYLHQ